MVMVTSVPSVHKSLSIHPASLPPKGVTCPEPCGTCRGVGLTLTEVNSRALFLKAPPIYKVQTGVQVFFEISPQQGFAGDY